MWKNSENFCCTFSDARAFVNCSNCESNIPQFALSESCLTVNSYRPQLAHFWQRIMSRAAWVHCTVTFICLRGQTMAFGDNVRCFLAMFDSWKNAHKANKKQNKTKQRKNGKQCCQTVRLQTVSLLQYRQFLDWMLAAFNWAAAQWLQILEVVMPAIYRKAEVQSRQR